MDPQLPQIALGTAGVRGTELFEAVKYAIEVGYRHFDTAWLYQNEKEVGAAIQEKINANEVTREDIFLTTKLWTGYHSGNILRGCKESLDNLGLQYIDLYLMHWPFYLNFTKGTGIIDDSKTDPDANEVDFVTVYKEMEECVRLGLVRNLGVSNFNAQQIERLCKKVSIKPCVNQIECNLQLNQKELVKFCRDRDIKVMAYCPLGCPKYGKVSTFLVNEEVRDIAKGHRKSPAQIALRFLVEAGTIPIPKAVNQEHIRENFEIFNFELSESEKKLLEALNTGKRIIDVPFRKSHKYYPF